MGSYESVLIIILSIGIVIFVIHMTIFEIIKKTSVMYKNLKILNNRYVFKKNELPKQIEIYKKCKTKLAYDKSIIDDYLQQDIQTKISTYDELINKNETVHQQYNSYIKEYNILLPEKLSHISIFKFKNIKIWIINLYEHLIFKTHKLKPLRYTKAMVKITYRSPQGKNSYEKHHTYSYGGLKRQYDYVKKIIAQKSTRENLIRIERSKVTPSLRLSILKRDNYTCQKCYATKDDGVMLHVDHIVPVSKGGKTEESNLQTLCDWCNLAKSNKEN